MKGVIVVADFGERSSGQGKSRRPRTRDEDEDESDVSGLSYCDPVFNWGGNALEYIESAM